MNYNQKVINFSIECFKKVNNEFLHDEMHKHVLKSKHENFFGTTPTFKFHRWAGSLKSSQAFTYNIFSGITEAELEFEYSMWALDKNPLHKACIDVAIEDENNVVSLYEVKMFEIINCGKDRIFHKKEQEKYFSADNYKWNKQIAEPFIAFIQDVKSHFNNQSIYGEGIKQLCCHLLGIINEMTIKDGKLINKKAELYSLCFDRPFLPRFLKDIENYKETLQRFKCLLDRFLEEIDMDSQIKYHGYLAASEYIKENRDLLGSENCNYVMNRYYRESKQES